MQIWRFLLPPALGFTARNFLHAGLDKLTGKPSRPLRAMAFVEEHARRGDPEDVLRTLDRFAREVRWLMSVGPEKDQLLKEVAVRLPEKPRVLELGAYCGYSSIFIAHLLGVRATVTSIEIDPRSVEAARRIVEVAGLSDRIRFLQGSSSEVIPTLEGSFDLVFLDHWKDLYLKDLKLLEQHERIRSGAIVVADNVGEIFGAKPYLDYVRGSDRYDSENRPATIEYTRLPDAVEISVLR